MKLSLVTGEEFVWEVFWSSKEATWEVVFTTWVTGYELTLTDPSFAGQIIVFTQPLIWNYWIPSAEKDQFGLYKNFESWKIHARWIVVSEYSKNFSHWKAIMSLHEYLIAQEIPWISWVDTRQLTKLLRDNWSTLGRISNWSIWIDDPNLRNLVSEVTCKEIINYKGKWRTVLMFDFGIKENIIKEFLTRWVNVIRVPYDADITNLDFDWVFLSNWPWDPEVVLPYVKKAMDYVFSLSKPIFWICLWNQILGLCAWWKTEKMPFGHRWINQPCINHNTWKCYITSQNHGYHVKANSLPSDWEVWWTNANDLTVEWIRHKSRNIFSVQFHPESNPGPEDTSFLFDDFIKMLG